MRRQLNVTGKPLLHNIFIKINCRHKLEQMKENLPEIITSVLKQKFINTGKSVDVQSRQKRRKLALLKESCYTALRFADTFNIDLLSVVLRTRKNNEIIKIQYQQNNEKEVIPAQTTTVDSSSITTLQQVLYLLDKFAVSDEFYHELAMLFPSLPRSYLVKETRKRISNSISLERLPAPFYGQYRSLKECIKEALLTKVIIKVIFIGLWQLLHGIGLIRSDYYTSY